MDVTDKNWPLVQDAQHRRPLAWTCLANTVWHKTWIFMAYVQPDYHWWLGTDVLGQTATPFHHLAIHVTAMAGPREYDLF